MKPVSNRFAVRLCLFSTHLDVAEKVVQTNQPHVVKERDSDVLGVSGHVDHLADVQQARVVERERQVGLDEARRGTVRVTGHIQWTLSSLAVCIGRRWSQLCHKLLVHDSREV